MHCAVVCGVDNTKLILSENTVGDVASEERPFSLSSLRVQEFDAIEMGSSGSAFELADVLLHVGELDDDAIAQMFNSSLKSSWDTVGSMDVKGDLQVSGGTKLYADTEIQGALRHTGDSTHTGNATFGGQVQSEGSFKADVFRFRDKNNHDRDKTSLEYNGQGGINVYTDKFFDIFESDQREKAFSFDANGKRFCIGGTCVDENNINTSEVEARLNGVQDDVQRLQREVRKDTHDGDFKIRGGDLDVCRASDCGSDAGRMRTFYSGADFHLGLEEYDDSVHYDMKTTRNNDVASLFKTGGGDVYLRNGNGNHVHLKPNGEFCIGGACMSEDMVKKIAKLLDDGILNSQQGQSNAKPPGTIVLETDHDPLDAVNIDAYKKDVDYFVVDSNQPYPGKYTYGYDLGSSARNFEDLTSDLKRTPFGKLVFLKRDTTFFKYMFEVNSMRDYSIDVFLVSNGGHNDSFYMELDKEGMQRWDTGKKKGEYRTWKTTQLKRGKHTLEILGREPTGLGAVRIRRR